MKLTFSRNPETRVEDSEVLYELQEIAESMDYEEYFEDLDDAVTLNDFFLLREMEGDAMSLMTEYMNDSDYYFNPFSNTVHTSGVVAKELTDISIVTFREMKRNLEKETGLNWFTEDAFAQYLDNCLQPHVIEKYRHLNDRFYPTETE